MLYLSAFTFPTEDDEWEVRRHIKLNAYQTIYPFYILPQKGLREIWFAPVTILYGGNGSGKSTVLNVIAEKLSLKRDTPYNRSSFFGQYVSMCTATLEEPVPETGRIITSDDVFDFMLQLRALNDGIDRNRDELVEEYFRLKKERFQVRSLEDYDALRRINDTRRMTTSAFVRKENQENIREQSNGESADYYFRSRIGEDTLCLLDEPENSLSPARQIELAQYLSDSARFCGCQLIISTHSPFLLALPGAKIIDLDHDSRIVDSWLELDAVRAYFDFFEKHRGAYLKRKSGY